MHRIKTNSPTSHVERLRQQFALLGQDTFCKALGSDQVERILREEVGRPLSRRWRLYKRTVKTPSKRGIALAVSIIFWRSAAIA